MENIKLELTWHKVHNLLKLLGEQPINEYNDLYKTIDEQYQKQKDEQIQKEFEEAKIKQPTKN
jgi:hypothetical protein